MPNTLSYDSQLIDECLMTAGIAVAEDQISPLAVFQNENGQSEVLVIHQDTELYHVAREPLSQSGWNMYGVGAQLGSAVLMDASTAYAIGNNDDVEQGLLRTLNNGHWDVTEVPLSVGSLFNGWDGTVWAYGSSGSTIVIYQLSNGNWQICATLPEATPNLSNIAGSAGDVWVVDVAGDVTNYANDPQTPPQYEGNGTVVAVVPAPNGSIWMFDDSGLLYELDDQQWKLVANPPGNFTWLAADAQGTLWGIYQLSEQSPKVLGYLSENGVWEQLTSPPTTLGSSASIGLDGSILILDANGVAWILAGGPLGSWQRQMTPTGMHGYTYDGQVTEVVAGQDADQAWHAFYVQDGSLSQIDLRNGTWNSPVSLGDVGGNIGLTNSQRTGELIGYGISADGNFLVFQDAGAGQYQSNEFPVQPGLSLSNVTTNLTVINDNMWITTAVIGDALTQVWGSKAAPTTYPGDEGTGFVPVSDAANPNQIRDNMDQVIRLPWVQAESSLPYSAVLDNDGNIFMVFNLELVPLAGVSSGYYNQLSGSAVSALSSVTNAGAIMDSNGMARIYAADSNFQVWVIRQTGAGGNAENPWTWTQWHPLGDNCIYLANGPGPLQTTELLTISADNTLYVIDQDAVTQRWSSSLIKRPSGTVEDFDELTLYKTEISVLDEDGNPAPDSLVNVTVAEPALLWIEGVEYTLDSGQSVSGTTNAMGKLRLTTPATRLHTSPLTVTLNGAGDAQTIYPPQNVHDFLAGNKSLGGGRMFTAGGNALINATDYNGDPFTGFTGLAQNPNVPAAASLIMKIAQAQPGSNSLAFTLVPDFKVSAGLTSARSFWDDLWNDLASFSEDIFYAIRNEVIRVIDVTFSETEKLVTATLQFVGDTVQRIVQFAVNTYHDIANALHTAFLWIKAKVDSVIDWLKALFDWSAIQHTQAVFAYYIGQSIPWLQTQVSEGEVLVNNFFQNLEGDVSQGFEWLKTYLGDQTMDETASNPSADSQIDFNGLKFPPGIFQFGTEVNWLFEKVESYLFGSSLDSLNPITIVQQAAQTFWNVSQPAWADLEKAIGSFKSFVQGAVSHPGDFKQLAAKDLINAIEEVILAALQFADAVVQAFLSLINAALGYVDEIMKYNINIPLVSKLFKEFVGQPLTALNLFTMLLAVPVTVGYKLASGNRYLFTEQQVAEITGQAEKRALPGSLAVDRELVTAFYFCSGAVTLIWAGFDTTLDAFKAAPPLGLQILDIIFPTVLQVFGWPGGIPFAEIPMQTAAEKWGFGSWITGWAPIPLNIALLLIGELLSKDTSKVARYSDPVGKGILTGIGLLNLGVGAAASGLGQKDGSVSGAGVVANTLSPMPNLFQWLRIEALEDETEELTYYIKLLVDFFTGAGAAISIFVEGNQTSDA